MNTEDVDGIKILLDKNTANEVVSDRRETNFATLPAKSNPLSTLTKHPLFAPLFYITAGILVLFIFIAVFFTYVSHLKVETAVVSALIDTMVAPVNGYISEVYVTEGDQIKKGASLLKIENIDLERELQLARVKLEESTLSIDYYQHLLSNEQQRLKLYKKIGHSRVTSAKTLVKMSQQELITAEHNLDRVKNLYSKHYASGVSLEAGQSQYVSAQEKLKHAKAHQSLENHSLAAVKKGIYFTGNKTEGIANDLYAELTAAKQRATLDANRVKIYENLINKLTLIAPYDGKITRILTSPGNTTNTIKPIILIERISIKKKIIAYLTQDEIIHIGSSRGVKIYIPSSGKTYRGKIIEINRTEGFVDEVKAQYRWRDFQIDRSGMVTISINESDQNTFDKEAFSGMPAIVYFPKIFIFDWMT